MIVSNNLEHGHNLAGFIGSKYDPRTCSNIARVDKGVLVGGCIYNDFTRGGSISIHVVGLRPHWINRDLLYLAFAYPFNQLRVERLFAPCPSNNFTAMKFIMHAGFKLLRDIPGFYPNNVARLYYFMDRDDCRFLQVKPRFIRRKAA